MIKEKFELCCWCETDEHPPFEEMHKVSLLSREVYEKAKECHWKKIDAINEYDRQQGAFEKNRKDAETFRFYFLMFFIILFGGAIVLSLMQDF